jgi:hypothetical protein
MEWEYRLQELTQLIKDGGRESSNHSLRAGLKGVKLLCAEDRVPTESHCKVTLLPDHLCPEQKSTLFFCCGIRRSGSNWQQLPTVLPNSERRF